MKRRQIYINSGESQLFGWIHYNTQDNPAVSSKNVAAVICNPIGWEYTHSHRTVRHLADSLATLGIPACRFDYQGTGDSPGLDLDPNRLETWQKDIQAAIDFTRRATGCEKICLIGIRLGATLAAWVATQQEVDFLILWNPVISGRRYVREIHAIAATSGLKKSSNGTALETAGFLMSNETIEEIKHINLLQKNLRINVAALVIDRDDLEADTSLVEKLRKDQIATEHHLCPGYTEMMAEPQFAQVPKAALKVIADWLTRKCTNLPVLMPPKTNTEIGFAADDQIPIRERACHFGSDENLFGILSFLELPANLKPVILLLNSGSVHHVGPNRLYVLLARRLASLGYTTFRMDFQGLGDSVGATSRGENHPYPDSAVKDTECALKFLNEKFGCTRFVLLGLCSGAHTAFHAGLEITGHDIIDTVLINPLTFHWVEGMSLATNHFQEVAYYKHTMKSTAKWAKVLKGQIDYRRAAEVVFKQLQTSATNLLTLGQKSKLSTDLLKFSAQGRPLTLFVSDLDPGYDILIDGAKTVALAGIKSGEIRVHRIKDADHTFTTLEPRNDLINRVCAHLKQNS